MVNCALNIHNRVSHLALVVKPVRSSACNNILTDQHGRHECLSYLSIHFKDTGQVSVVHWLVRRKVQLHFGVVVGATAAFVGFVLEQPFAAPNK